MKKRKGKREGKEGLKMKWKERIDLIKELLLIRGAKVKTV